jgi:multiple sugar transport system substrate-binding protein
MITVRIALVGGPMYDQLYAAIPDFERASGIRVEIVAQLPHPELNAFVKHAFESRVPLDAISTHTKYSPSQAPWLRAIDDVMPDDLVGDLLPRPAELSRIDGRLMQIPRNLDALSHRPPLVGANHLAGVARNRDDADTLAITQHGALLWFPVPGT